MKLYESIKNNLKESSNMPTTEEVRDRLKKEYNTWRTRSQQQAFADDTVAKMPVGTIIDTRSSNNYHDTHAIFEKVDSNKWVEHWVGNPGRSNEEEYWQKEVSDYDVIDGMYNDFKDDGETSAIVDNFVIKYNTNVKEAEKLNEYGDDPYYANQENDRLTRQLANIKNEYREAFREVYSLACGMWNVLAWDSPDERKIAKLTEKIRELKDLAAKHK